MGLTWNQLALSCLEKVLRGVSFKDEREMKISENELKKTTIEFFQLKKSMLIFEWLICELEPHLKIACLPHPSYIEPVSRFT